MSDYKAMDSAEMLAAMGMDGRNWTEAFRQINPDCNVDDDTMLGWFCNAIMAGHDAALGNPPLNGDHAEWLIEQDKANGVLAVSPAGQRGSDG